MRILNCNKPYFVSLLHWFFIVLNLIFLVVEDQLWCQAVETKHWEKILLMCLDPSRYWINYICYWYFILANYYLLVDVDIYRFLVYVGFKLLSLKFYKCKLICLWRCKVLWSSRNMTQVKKLWMSSISSSLKISGIASGLLYNYSESFDLLNHSKTFIPIHIVRLIKVNSKFSVSSSSKYFFFFNHSHSFWDVMIYKHGATGWAVIFKKFKEYPFMLLSYV